ncbi:MAG: hypothetical protein ACLSFO_01715 [Anaerovoracaceae bacterium]
MGETLNKKKKFSMPYPYLLIMIVMVIINFDLYCAFGTIWHDGK